MLQISFSLACTACTAAKVTKVTIIIRCRKDQMHRGACLQTTQGVQVVKHPELVNIPEVNLDNHVPEKERRRAGQSPSTTTGIVEEALNGYMHVPRFHRLVKKLSSDYSLVPAAVRGRDVELLSLWFAFVRIYAPAANGQRLRVDPCAVVRVQEAVYHITQFPRKCVNHLAAHCLNLDLSVCLHCSESILIACESIESCGMWDR
jgi:hypothetical protein